jgi:lysine 6-dehydrogenase
MTYQYVILGAGRQGTAAAYDLAKFGDATKVILADINPAAAQASADRINSLLNKDIAQGVQVDVTNPNDLQQLFENTDGVLSAVPYYYNLDITRAALATGTHLCDMGGNTDVVFEQIKLGEADKSIGVSIVPDCGMGPGLINTMAAYIIEALDETEDIRIYDGGVPQKPTPPWNYEALFHINGLTNEYFGTTAFLKDGKIDWVEGITEYEVVEIPKMGTMEAFITTGGTSTAPWTWEGKVKSYRNKTLRWPGHFAWFEGFKHLGLFDLEPIQVGEQTVVPRDVFHALLAPRIHADDPRDICVIHMIGTGKKESAAVTMTLDLIDYYDETTGFLAMERLTGWHCAIMLGFQVRGQVRAGGVAMETAVSPAAFMAEIEKRDISFEVTQS